MNTGYITLTFDEPVRSNTFNATGITLYGVTSVYSVNRLELSYETITDSRNGLSLSVELSYDDFNLIKANPSIGMARSSR
tara:strand:+ start:139 stop:378 length:240 start_codon:yes stop_codon:yes gene_type:complete